MSVKKLAAVILFFLRAAIAFADAPVSTPAAPPPAPENESAAEMVFIEAGSFTQGCDKFGSEHGAPAHTVYLDAFWMDKYEVTNKKFEEVIPDHNLRRSMFSACDDCPVTKLTWYDAVEYCYLIGKSLPSEAQWEKAAGAADGCEYPWGPEFDPKRAHGGLKLKDKVTPVGSYPPNKYGIHDMAGSVWEWVADWFSPEYYIREIMANPRGPVAGQMKVRRGGSWSDSIKSMAAGYRDWSYPFSRSLNDVGFRCAMSAKASHANPGRN